MKTSKSLIKKTKLTLALAIVTVANQISAQDSGDTVTESSSATTLEEIIVTARKREESLMDIPVSVTAFSAQELESAGLENVLDIALATPGLVFESFNTFPGRQDSVPFIRGVVFDNVDATRQTVSVFLDGIYVAGGTKGLGVEDIERVEVIKGSQSAIFGRTTFAGAINYVTKDPGDEFGGKISVTAASRGEYEGTLSIDAPLSDVLKARASIRFKEDGGHYNNEAVPGQELGQEETFSINGTLLFEPTENFRSKLRVNYTELDDGPAAFSMVDSTFNNFGPFNDGTESIFAGTLPEITSAAMNTSSADAAAIRQIVENGIASGGYNLFGSLDNLNEFGLNSESTRISLHSTLDIGDITADLILGYNNEDSFLMYDIDYTSDFTYVLFNDRRFEDKNIELRFSGQSLNDNLDWSVGASYFNLELESAGSFVTPVISTVFGSGLPSTTDIETTGIFWQLGYQFTDRFRADFEGRYQRDKVDDIGTNGVSVEGSPETFTNFLPRLTLEYTPTDTALIYFNFSEGNLPGGFNSAFFDLTPAQQEEAIQNFNAGGQFEEEKLTNYELGLKQSFLDGKASLTLAGFFMEREDQGATVVAQLTGDPSLGEPAVITQTLTINAATSDIYGLELEGDLAASNSLSLSATLAYVKTEIKSFPDSGDAGDFTDVLGTTADFRGIEAERYPDIQATLSATFTNPNEISLLGHQGNWYVRGDLFYAGKYYLSTVNVGQAPTVTDLRLRTGFRADDFSLELFATNVLNEKAPSAANNSSDLSNNTPLFAFGIEATQVGLRDKPQVGLRTTLNF